jgi:hypothetical protein
MRRIIPCAIECLELRRLLAITITGTAGNDVISAELRFDGSVVDVTINGAISTRAVGTETLVVINGLGGDDTINIGPMVSENRTTRLDCSAQGGTGNDQVRLGPAETGGSSEQFQSTTLTGGDGIDTLVIGDDEMFPAHPVFSHNYHFDSGILTIRNRSPLLLEVDHDYATFETIIVNAGDHNNDFVIGSPGDEDQLIMHGNEGNDELRLQRSSNSVAFSFFGEVGTDSVIVDNATGGGTPTYFVGPSSLDMPGFGALSYQTHESLALLTNNLGATVNLSSTSPGVTTSITGGSGADLFNIGTGDWDAQITGSLTIDGAGNTDTMIIDDALDTQADRYTLSNGVVSNNNSPFTVSYAQLEDVQIDGSAQNNVFTLGSAGSATSITLRGFAGNDTFVVTPSPTAATTIDGGVPTVAPADLLLMSGAAPAGSATFTPNGTGAGSYMFASAGPITFSGLESFPVPPAVPTVPDLVAADDTGISSGDNITSRTTVTFTGSGPGGLLVVLRAGTTTLATGTISTAGNWSVPVTFAGDGSFAVTASSRLPGSDLTGQPSAPLNVTIDTVAPAPPTAAPDLAASTDHGVSNSDNITNDPTPRFAGSVTPSLIARLFADGAEVGADSTTADGTYAVIPGTALADGVRSMTTKFEDLAGNISGSSPALPVTIDTVAPALNASVFDFLTAQAVRFIFSEDVGPTISVADLTLEHLTNGTVPTSSIAMTYAPHTARFTFPGFNNSILPDGDYTAQLGQAITDIAGNTLGPTPALGFFFLNGDADRNRIVNLGDFNILATNFGQSNRNFSQADFTYDGVVNLADFNVLASRFGASLGAEQDEDDELFSI